MLYSIQQPLFKDNALRLVLDLTSYWVLYLGNHYLLVLYFTTY